MLLTNHFPYHKTNLCFKSLVGKEGRKNSLTMIQSRFSTLSHPKCPILENPVDNHCKSKITCIKKPISSSSSSSSASFSNLLHKSVLPIAASVTILLSTTPAEAGLMSGFSGIESIPGPELPEMEFLKRFNESNQKKYAENDARFKESPLLKKLLEQSKLNKEKNKQEVLDKYCIRGAEWGVGDCSTVGMSEEEKDSFIAMLKKKAGTSE